MSRSRIRPAIGLLVALLVGCQAGGTGVAPAASRSPGKAPKAGASPTPAVRASSSPALGEAPVLRPLPADAALFAVSLTGKVKLISDRGGSVISNNGGGIVSNNGGAIVSNNGGALVSNNGAGVVANGGARLELLAAAPESLLADARVEVVDLAGKVLAKADGTPIAATSDASGGFTLEAALPKENFLLRVRLWNGGTLLAVLAADAPPKRALDLDTASSLGTSYVLDRYVKAEQAVFDRLPDAAAADLTRAIEAAREALETTAPSYAPADLAAATERLRGEAAGVDESLERIEALLLAGQKQLGEGRLATDVALSSPNSILVAADGSLLISEGIAGRVRELRDGRVRTYVADRVFGAGALKAQLGAIEQMERAPDGSLVFAEPLNGRVRRLAPDGTLSVVADGLRHPGAIAVAADGTVYVGEAPDYPAIAGTTGKIFRVAPGGTPVEVPTTDARWTGAHHRGMAVGPDGTLHVAPQGSPHVMRLKPGGAWEFSPHEFHGHIKKLHVTADGTLYVGEKYGRRLFTYDFAKPPVLVAGRGERGDDGDGGPATQARFFTIGAIARGRDGTVYVADEAQGTIRAIDAAGVIRTIAGGSGDVVVGDALDVPVNSPAGLAYDPAGRIVVAETGGQTVKRLENGRWAVVAGGGDEYDAPAATAVRLNSPVGLAFQGEAMIVADTANGFIRRIAADGTAGLLLGKVVSHGQLAPILAASFPAAGAQLTRPTSVLAGPAGDLYVADSGNGVVLKIDAAGQATLVAGVPAVNGQPAIGTPVDGAPATASKLGRPFGLARDAAGNLYVSDAGNLQVYRIGPDGRIKVVAGIAMTDQAKLLARASDPAVRAGAAPLDAFLAGPAGLAFAPDGALLIALAGTRSLKLAGNVMPVPANPLIDAFDVPAAIVRLSPDGTRLDPIAGTGGRVLADPDAEDALVLPIGIAVGPAGQLAIADFGANQIRGVPAEALR